MADTLRTLAALQTLLADNTSGAITAQVIRDMLVSVYPTGRTLLASQTASSSPQLDFTSRNAPFQSGDLFQTDFDMYEVDFIDVVPATDNTNLYVRVSYDNGSNWRATSGDYFFHAFWSTNQPATGVYNDGSYVSTAFVVAPGIDTGAAAGLKGVSGRMTFVQPATAQNHKAWWTMNFYNNSNRSEREEGFGWHTQTSAVNALRVLMNSGNIASGTVRVYGIPK